MVAITRLGEQHHMTLSLEEGRERAVLPDERFVCAAAHEHAPRRVQGITAQIVDEIGNPPEQGIATAQQLPIEDERTGEQNKPAINLGMMPTGCQGCDGAQACSY
jgi:hypothetical protein